MENSLRRLQLEQLAMLKLVDRFCRRRGIRYSLYAGTLLGAVRHGGFIPWDDDLDVCMPREDYLRFLSEWDEPGYLLQNRDNTPAFTQSFTKLRKKNTTFLTAGDLGRAYHTGIFLDIFPVDRSPGGWCFAAEVMVYQLMVRQFPPPAGPPPVRLIAGLLLRLLRGRRREALRHFLLKRITARRDPGLSRVTIETVEAARQLYSPDLFEHYVELPFEDGSFLAVADWDQLLRVKYGDYRRLPPEGERTWKHRPLILDFEGNSQWDP